MKIYGDNFKGFWNSCSYGLSNDKQNKKYFLESTRGYIYNDICNLAKSMDKSINNNKINYKSYNDYLIQIKNEKFI